MHLQITLDSLTREYNVDDEDIAMTDWNDVIEDMIDSISKSENI